MNQISDPARWRPVGCKRIGLVLQGGGALGAYQAGVYQALHEAGLDPDWLAGVSIGAINAALIAGNPRERRVERLRMFWELVTSRPVWGFSPDGDALRQAHTMSASLAAAAFGQPGFFEPRVPTPWLRPRGAAGATSLYDSAPLLQTLLDLVDFDRLNDGEVRIGLGAVNVATGNFAYFDTRDGRIGPEHVMASGALPPALPPIKVGDALYWDGGIVSNTPLQHLLDNIGQDDMLVFQVDLFSARGVVPRDMMDTLGRDKDIRYSSRTRLTTDYYTALFRQKVQLRGLLARLPENELTEDDRALRRELDDLPSVNIIQLILQPLVWQGQARDYDFSREAMTAHWDAGLRDTRRTLARPECLAMPGPDVGIVTHDVHRQRA